MNNLKQYSLTIITLIILIGLGNMQPAAAQPPQPQNVVFILSDDHRYDFMGFHENAPSYNETPIRASILTGQPDEKLKGN